MLHATVKEGMYFGDIKRENNMLTVLWMLNKATSSPDDYLASPLHFLSVEHWEHILWLFWSGGGLALGDYIHTEV